MLKDELDKVEKPPTPFVPLKAKFKMMSYH